MIKRIAQTAGFTGLLAALLLTLLQSFWVAPLILQAETFENAPATTRLPPVVESTRCQPSSGSQASASWLWAAAPSAC